MGGRRVDRARAGARAHARCGVRALSGSGRDAGQNQCRRTCRSASSLAVPMARLAGPVRSGGRCGDHLGGDSGQQSRYARAEPAGEGGASRQSRANHDGTGAGRAAVHECANTSSRRICVDGENRRRGAGGVAGERDAARRRRAAGGSGQGRPANGDRDGDWRRTCCASRTVAHAACDARGSGATTFRWYRERHRSRTPGRRARGASASRCGRRHPARIRRRGVSPGTIFAVARDHLAGSDDPLATRRQRRRNLHERWSDMGNHSHRSEHGAHRRRRALSNGCVGGGNVRSGAALHRRAHLAPRPVS